MYKMLLGPLNSMTLRIYWMVALDSSGFGMFASRQVVVILIKSIKSFTS